MPQTDDVRVWKAKNPDAYLWLYAKYYYPRSSNAIPALHRISRMAKTRPTLEEAIARLESGDTDPQTSNQEVFHHLKEVLARFCELFPDRAQATQAFLRGVLSGSKVPVSDQDYKQAILRCLDFMLEQHAPDEAWL